MNNMEIKVLKIIRIIEINRSLKVKASTKINTMLNSRVETNEYFRNHLTSVTPGRHAYRLSLPGLKSVAITGDEYTRQKWMPPRESQPYGPPSP